MRVNPIKFLFVVGLLLGFVRLSAWGRKNLNLLVVVSFFILTTSFAFAQTISEFSLTKPIHYKILGSSTFKTLKARKLQSANVVYINHQGFKDLGVSLDGLSEQEIEQQILDNFAWVTKESLSETTRNEKTFYVDYYGGRGLGDNLGSGRAMIAGAFQVKGVGLTPMSSKDARFRLDGTVELMEAMKETIWGQFLNRVLPFGAHPVLALISYKNDIRPDELSYLIVRQSPLRLGHLYTPNHLGGRFQNYRARQAVKNLANHLSNSKDININTTLDDLIPPHVPQRAKALIHFSEQWLYRATEQIARTYFQKIAHGATTESNIMINGGLMDFETASTTAGFDPIKYLPFEDAFTNFNSIHDSWGMGHIYYLLDKQKVPDEILSKVDSYYTVYWQAAFQKNFLLNMGFSNSKIDALMASDQNHEDLEKLIHRITQLTYAGSKESIAVEYYGVPEETQGIKLDLVMSGLIAILEASTHQKIVTPRKYFGFTFNSLKISQKALTSILALWNTNVEDSLKSLLDDEVPNPFATLRYRMMWQNRIRRNLFDNHLKDKIFDLSDSIKRPDVNTKTAITKFIENQIQQAEPNLSSIDLTRFVPISFQVNPVDSSINLKVYNIYEDREQELQLDKHGKLLNNYSRINITPPAPAVEEQCLEFLD